jgi:hypothetical protein
MHTLAHRYKSYVPEERYTKERGVEEWCPFAEALRGDAVVSGADLLSLGMCFNATGFIGYMLID